MCGKSGLRDKDRVSSTSDKLVKICGPGCLCILIGKEI